MRILPFLLTLLAVQPMRAQQVTAPIEHWRVQADSAVSQGNRAHLRSDRNGMKQAIHMLSRLLTDERPAGGWTEADSLVYTADLLKLWGNYLYELAPFVPSFYADSRTYMREALRVYEGHPALNQAHITCVLHKELAQLHFRQANYDEALAEMDLALGDYRQRLLLGEIDPQDPLGTEPFEAYLRTLSAHAICLARCRRFTEALEEAEEAVKSCPSHASASLRAELMRRHAKVMILADEAHASTAHRRQALTLYSRCFALQRPWCLSELRQRDRSDRQSFWLHMRPFVADAYRTENSDPSLLYDLTLFTKALLLHVENRNEAALRAKWTDVQRHLLPDEAAVEFISYEANGQERMAALVLRQKGRPEWVSMPSPDSVAHTPLEDMAVERWLTSMDKQRILSMSATGSNRLTVGDCLQSTSGICRNALADSESLRYLFWPAELRRALHGAKRVFFAPDAYQHRVAIEYFFPDASTHLHRLTSTARLLDRPAKGRPIKVRTDSALLCGNVAYDISTRHPMTMKNDTLALRIYLDERASFSQLLFSADELRRIRSIRRCESDVVLHGAMADEGTFRTLAGHYPLVFLSTHGDFDSAERSFGTDLLPCHTDISLSENVVAFAGVNESMRRWASAPLLDSRRTDGLLSAAELAEMDLSGTDLFIVSACQSALGHITSEGVYGIQRGLKLAGAQALMLSLWNVSDAASSLLMQHFIEQLGRGLSPHDALAHARQKLRTDDVPDISSDTPNATSTPNGPINAMTTPANHQTPEVNAMGRAATRSRFNAATLTAVQDPDTPSDIFNEARFTDAFILIDDLP